MRNRADRRARAPVLKRSVAAQAVGTAATCRKKHGVIGRQIPVVAADCLSFVTSSQQGAAVEAVRVGN